MIIGNILQLKCRFLLSESSKQQNNLAFGKVKYEKYTNLKHYMLFVTYNTERVKTQVQL